MMLDDCPLTPFHVRIALAGTGGQFSDGYILGIIGIALTVAGPELHLDAFWLGILGAASLAGLFAGSLFSGPILDHFGRRGLFNYDMALFAVISLGQFWVESAEQLLVLRLLLGVVLGFDYVVSKALVIEYAPRRLRGRMLSGLGIAWALGYLSAYAVGYLLKDYGPNAWRLMLVSSAIPSALIFLLRVNIPESALWLQRKGRTQEAMAIIRRYFGPGVVLSSASSTATGRIQKVADAKLFSRKWGKRLFSACFFYTCLVVPYYALGTFSPMVFGSLHIKDKFLAGLVYNIFLLIGTVMGALIIDRISRRSFLLGGYFLCAIVLMALLANAYMPAVVTVGLFAVFALILSAVNNLVYLYPAELFPTEIRATGLGVAVAVSRAGSSLATFLLPTIVLNYGGSAAVSLCIAVLLFGGIGAFWAPETRYVSMGG
jgi:putative MFS transporter